jgi:hypothetical protein
MAARPPQDDAEEPDSLAFGIAALNDHLDRADLGFPAENDEIVRALGDPDVPCDPSGRSMALSVALDGVNRERFDSEDALLDALHPVFEERRQSSPTGLLDRLRSLF